LFLLIGPVALARDEEKHGIEVVEVFRVAGWRRHGLLRDPLRVGADVGVVQARFPAEAIDDAERVADGVVREAGARVTEGQQLLALRHRGLRRTRPEVAALTLRGDRRGRA